MISCGGTGGHITPALAIADTIMENDPRAKVLFVGSERGMENSLVPAAGYSMKTLRVEGLRRSLTLANLRVLWQAARAVGRAKGLIAEFAPDMVIGTGGYVCYPTLRAAAAMGIPTAVHESNATPGLAVKRLARRVDRVWLNFSVAQGELPRGSRVLTVGNPLRGGCQGAVAVSASTHGKKSVLSFGGSLGAGELNKAILSLMAAEQRQGGICHLHATGKGNFDAVHEAFCRMGLHHDPQFSVVPFITDMPLRMAQADLVICRAGAMSISELSALGKAVILIPSPNVTGNHQYKNARMLADASAACLLTEQELIEGALTDAVLSLLASDAKRQQLSQAIGRFAVIDANKRIWEDICKLVRK